MALARDFGASSAGRMTWAAAGGSLPTPLCHDNNPFDFVEGKILNLTLQYEAT